MACIFTTPNCGGLGTAPNECAYCLELGKDADLQEMAAIFPLRQIVTLLEPRVAAQARAPMRAVPITPGKHVNRAAVVGPAFDLSTLTRSAGDQNCALCAAAGGVNLAVGYVKFTTKKVAKLHHVGDDLQAFGKKREEQEEKIVRFVASNLPGYQLAVYGSDSQRMDEATALAKMNACSAPSPTSPSSTWSARGVHVECTWSGFGQRVRMPSVRRSLQEIMMPVIEAGFRLSAVVEPKPTEDFRQADPVRYASLMHRPAFLCVQAQRD